MIISADYAQNEHGDCAYITHSVLFVSQTMMVDATERFVQRVLSVLITVRLLDPQNAKTLTFNSLPANCRYLHKATASSKQEVKEVDSRC